MKPATFAGETRNVFSARNVVRGWLVALALGLVWVTAQARGEAGRWTDVEWYNQTTGGATARTVPNGGSGPYSYSPASGGAYQKGQKALPWPGKNQAKAMAGWKALAKPGDMAKTVVNPLGGAINLLGAFAIKQLLDEACVRVFGGELKPGAAWDECIFSETQITQYSQRTAANLDKESTAVRFGWVNTPQEACNLYAGTLAEYSQWPSGQVTPSAGQSSYTATTNPSGSPSQPQYRRTWTASITGTPESPLCRVEQKRVTIANGVEDFYVVDAGTGFATQQGQSTTQTGWSPITEAQAESKLASKLGQWCQADFLYGRDGSQSTCASVLDELVTNNQTVEVDDPVLSGPVHVEGNCTTTKTITDQATGSYTLSTSCTDSDYDYTGNTVKRTEVKRDSTTPYNADGSEAGPTEETQEEKQDERTLCEKDPTAFGCDDSLDVPNGEIPREVKTLTYVAESLGFGAGSCPADIVKTVGGHAVTVFSYAKPCDFIKDYVKPLVLMLSAWIAFVILMPGGVGRSG